MKFKFYNESYLQEVVRLLNLCFPDNHITPATFLWKHYSDYFKHQTISAIAIEGNQICSFACFTPVRILTQTGQIKTFYSCAVQATHPEFRRQGLISQITQIIEAKLGPDTSYFGFSNQQGVNIDKYSQTINYQILGQLQTRYFFAFPYKTDLKVEEARQITNPLSHPHFHQIYKDHNYLDWRYYSNPKIDYLYLNLHKAGKILAHAICYSHQSRLTILDLIVTKMNSKLYQSILKSVINYAFHQKKLLVDISYLDNQFWRNSMPNISFIKKQPFYFTVKSKHKSFLNPDNWLIQAGDIQ